MCALAAESYDIQIRDENLPVLSVVASQAMTLISSGSASANELEHLIRKDPSLTSSILRLANSPLFAARVKATSITQCIVRLGLPRLKNAIMIAATGDVFDQTDAHARGLWQHSVAVAYISYWLSEMLRIGSPEDCFIGGMLHDMGKMAIYRQEPKIYASIMDEAHSKGVRFFFEERKRLKFCSHETVGGLIGRKWQLSTELVEVIRFHHEIEENPDCVAGTQGFVALVSAANLIAAIMGYSEDRISTGDLLESKPAAIIRLDKEAFDICTENLGAILKDQIASLA